MDYALEQLIGDTTDIRSAIRGHSMARDMYGDDGNLNGYLAGRPGGAAPTAPYNYSTFYIQSVAAGTLTNQYVLTTNIPVGDPALYGYTFTRWTLRVAYTGNLNTVTPRPPYTAQSLRPSRYCSTARITATVLSQST